MVILVFTLTCHAGSSYDRELVVKDQARAMEAEAVLSELITAYENEDARQFLDYVSEDRFRQNYLTFTDALYQDFRTYEIHHVEYWVRRVVSNHLKQLVFVDWEKRYETLEDSQQLFRKGYSCFVFDEINGDYLLIELKGDDLFGSSLAEWTEETPTIPGQSITPGNAGNDAGTPSTGTTTPVALPDLLVGLIYQTGSSSIDVSIHNLGTAPSPATQILMEENIMTSPFSSTLTLPPLAPGGVHTFSHFFGGPEPYRVTVDPNNMVQESNETNNSKEHH